MTSFVGLVLSIIGTVFAFVKNQKGKLHYISVEYTADDLVSYEMVRDTYSFN
ncbi:MAG: hypothetical protein IKH20_10400 [Clostridiales bacterium]|nr:hypothetical protein [Clostridiales bacterium]